MKNARSYRRAAIYLPLIVITLLLGALLLPSTAYAADVDADMNGDAPYLDIVANNLLYNEKLEIYYAIDTSLPEGVKPSDIRMMFWNAPQESYTRDNPNILYTRSLRQIDTIYVGDTVYEDAVLFKSAGINMCEIIDEVYARAYVVIGGVTYYSDVSKYSVLEYLTDRYYDLDNAPPTTDEAVLKYRHDQRILYDAILELGAAAQEVFDYKADTLVTDPYVLVDVRGAAVGDFTRNLYPKGAEYTFTATDTDNFSHWEYNGKVISVEQSITIPLTESGTLRAVSNTVGGTTLVVSVIGGTGSGEYEIGDSFTVTAEEREGYIFNKWSNGEMAPSFTVNVEATGTATYIAEYTKLNIATFDDAAEGKFNSGSYGGVSLSGSTSNEYGGYEIVYDPYDATNKVLYIYERTVPGEYSGASSNGSFTITASGEGRVSVFEFDLLVESSGGNSILFQLFFGNGGWSGAYQGRIDIAANAYYFLDIGTDGTSNDFGGEFERGEWVNVRYEYYPIGADNKGEMFNMVLYVNGEPIAISANPYGDFYSAVKKLHIWQMASLYGDFYFDNIRAYRTDSETLRVPENVDKYYQSSSEASWNNRYKRVERMYGKEVAEAVDSLTTNLFTEEIYHWIAGLYDPKTGGFYFSNSGRDTLGYLPDIETTAQASGVLSSINVGTWANLMNDLQKSKMSSWVQQLQSNRDGYLYHPQWGTDISDSRKGRDLGNGGSIITRGSNLTYTTNPYLFDHPYKRFGDTTASYVGGAVKLTYALGTSTAAMVSRVIYSAGVDESLPAHLQSEEAFRAYLEARWTGDVYSNNNYGFGNTVTAQGGQITAAGLGHVAIEFLNAKQRAVQVERARIHLGISSTDEAAIAAISEEDITKYANGVWQVDIREATAAEIEAYLAAVAAGETPALELLPVEEQVTDESGNATTVTKYYVDNYSSYNAVSGLLKISGVYSKMTAQIPYGKYALMSAVQMMCAPAEEYIARREAVVSVYNPPYSILNVMKNIRTYGDKTEIDEAEQIMRDNALAIIKTTEEKIAIYRRADGSFSYSVSGNCTHSQGEPVAVSGANEGDVNGMALALGARSMVLEVLGITNIPILPSYEGCTTYDFGDGLGEVPTTHAEIFKHLIAKAEVVDKVSVYDSPTEGIYGFEDSEGPQDKESGDSFNKVITDPANEENHLLHVKDGTSSSGYTVSFNSHIVPESDEFYYQFKMDMKFIGGASGYPIQINLGNHFRLQLMISNGSLSFQGRSTNDAVHEIYDRAISVNPSEWFNLDIRIYPKGVKFGDTVYYAKVVTEQNGATQFAYYKNFADLSKIESGMTSANVYSLQGAKPEYYLDNVVCRQYGNGMQYGLYDFDTYDALPKGVTGGKIVVGVDNMLEASGETIGLLTAPFYSSAFNFAELQYTMTLVSAEAGDVGYINLFDSEKRAIVSYKYVVGDSLITFYHVTGEGELKLLELAADLTGPLTVRSEYHYDRTIGGVLTPTLDFTVRYVRADNGLYNTGAATVSHAPVSQSGAVAEDYQTVDLIIGSDKVYIDDIFARRAIVETMENDEYYVVLPNTDYGMIEDPFIPLGVNDFNNGTVDGLSGSASYDISNGKMTIAPGGYSTLSFRQGNYDSDVSYKAGDVCYAEMEFTFNGAIPATAGSQPAFAGLLFSSSIHNSNMKYSMMKYAANDESGNASGLIWMGYTFKRGVTYQLRLEYVVGSGKIRTYVDGTLVSEAAHSSGASVDETRFYGLGFEFRSDSNRGTDFSFTIDNLDVRVDIAE